MTIPRGKHRRDQPRHKELVNVAARLFSERGFHRTSMEDIADALGILKGSLYYWIANKEELLEIVLLGTLEGGIAEGEKLLQMEMDAPDKLRLMIENHVAGWVRNPYHYNAFANEYKWLTPESLVVYKQENRRLEGIFGQIIVQGIESGRFQVRHEHVRVTVKLLMSMLNTFARWYKPDGWASPQTIAGIMVSQLLHGLSGQANVGGRETPTEG